MSGHIEICANRQLHCGDTAPYCGDQIEKVIDAQGMSFTHTVEEPTDCIDGRYTLRSAKLFGDGALGSRGAALLEDYTDKPGSKGFLIRPEKDWEPLIRQYHENVSHALLLVFPLELTISGLASGKSESYDSSDNRTSTV
jgi:hypothetical protein